MSKSARINFGIPDSEYIVRVDDTGAATSCYNQDTDTEYVGGGGGGDSDLSTAEVTIVNNSSLPTTINLAAIFEENSMGEGSPACIYIYPYEIDTDETLITNVPLYKNKYITDYIWEGYVVTLSGDAEFNYPLNPSLVIISGDCTITISE